MLGNNADYLRVAAATYRASIRPMPYLCEKRLRGEHVDPIGKKTGDSRISLAKKKTKIQQSKEEPTTREDLLLVWEARRGSSTALVGLGRGKEALTKATGATELADQVSSGATSFATLPRFHLLTQNHDSSDSSHMYGSHVRMRKSFLVSQTSRILNRVLFFET